MDCIFKKTAINGGFIMITDVSRRHATHPLSFQ